MRRLFQPLAALALLVTAAPATAAVQFDLATDNFTGVPRLHIPDVLPAASEIVSFSGGGSKIVFGEVDGEPVVSAVKTQPFVIKRAAAPDGLNDWFDETADGTIIKRDMTIMDAAFNARIALTGCLPQRWSGLNSANDTETIAFVCDSIETL